MFETIGVGDQQATVYGATLTWLIKGLKTPLKINQKPIGNYFEYL